MKWDNSGRIGLLCHIRRLEPTQGKSKALNYMKMVRKWRYSSTHFKSQHQIEVNDQLHASGKEPLASTDWLQMGPRVSLDVVVKENKKFLEELMFYFSFTAYRVFGTTQNAEKTSSPHIVVCIRCHGNVFTETLPSDLRCHTDSKVIS